jgi:hypothetical protein
MCDDPVIKPWPGLNNAKGYRCKKSTKDIVIGILHSLFFLDTVRKRENPMQSAKECVDIHTQNTEQYIHHKNKGASAT